MTKSEAPAKDVDDDLGIVGRGQDASLKLKIFQRMRVDKSNAVSTESTAQHIDV